MVKFGKTVRFWFFLSIFHPNHAFLSLTSKKRVLEISIWSSKSRLAQLLTFFYGKIFVVRLIIELTCLAAALSLNFSYWQQSFLGIGRRVVVEFNTKLKNPNMVHSSTHLLSMKFSDTGNFPNHRRVPLENVSVLWNKNFSSGNRDTPSYAYLFSIP